MKTEPIDERHPSLAGLARGHNKLHECLEEAREDIGAIKSDVIKIKHALGLDSGRKTSGLSSSWQAFRRTVYATSTSITALAVLWVAGRYIAWPMLVAGWQAFEAMARAGGI